MQEIMEFPARNGLNVTLRPAVSADAGGIISTLKSPADERSYVLMEHFGYSTAAESNYIEAMDNTRNLLLVAAQEDEIIGILGAFRTGERGRPDATGCLDIGLHIKETYRGLGIGSRMLEYSIEWARSHGFKQLKACIFTTNMASLSIFKRCGFDEQSNKPRNIRLGKKVVAEICLVKQID
jgi:GNAT superfamily N-acetyltransferase